MAFTLITSGDAAGASGGTTASLNTTGSTLLVAVVTFSGTTPVITDNKSNTWTALTVRTDTGVSNQIFYVNSATPTVGTGHTFTISAANSDGNIMAFSGGAAVPFDVQNGTNGASASAIQPGSVTPTTDNQIIITGLTAGNTFTTATIGGGFTITNQRPLTGGSNYGSAAAYLIQTTATAANPTWTLASGPISNVSTTIATFKAGVAVVQAFLSIRW